MVGVRSISEYRQALTPGQREIVDALRALVTSAKPDLIEHIKWNAPSFVCDGVDRITLGNDKVGRIRVILHRGAKPKEILSFTFDAPVDLVEWAASDRGVMTFASFDQVEGRANEIGEVFRRWLEIK